MNSLFKQGGGRTAVVLDGVNGRFILNIEQFSPYKTSSQYGYATREEAFRNQDMWIAGGTVESPKDR
jgi:hypothetical protein